MMERIRGWGSSAMDVRVGAGDPVVGTEFVTFEQKSFSEAVVLSRESCSTFIRPEFVSAVVRLLGPAFSLADLVALPRFWLRTWREVAAVQVTVDDRGYIVVVPTGSAFQGAVSLVTLLVQVCMTGSDLVSSEAGAVSAELLGPDGVFILAEVHSLGMSVKPVSGLTNLPGFVLCSSPPAKDVLSQESDDQGYCYLNLVCDKFKPVARQVLGSYPRVGSLLQAPREWYVASDRLSELPMEEKNGMFHVSSWFGPLDERLSASSVFQRVVDTADMSWASGSLAREFEFSGRMAGSLVKNSGMEGIPVGALALDYGPGLSYLHLVDPCCHPSAQLMLGKDPRWEALLASPAHWFLDFGRLNKVVVSPSANVHLVDHGGTTAYNLLLWVYCKVGHGSFRHSLAYQVGLEVDSLGRDVVLRSGIEYFDSLI